ncbi:hypothetical protein DFJ43DRAFT_893868 [Lentinula guzmanii]|uniref:Uncharacterized protein n=1 Tax=Lentinula guzmanii TaxID=2804957 RepID=A0AA38J9F7_9AGAR|nr:hypothetical protein DFJ43DRAFT_893868 [Lentinula guzmanii]
MTNERRLLHHMLFLFGLHQLHTSLRKPTRLNPWITMIMKATHGHSNVQRGHRSAQDLLSTNSEEEDARPQYARVVSGPHNMRIANILLIRINAPDAQRRRERDSPYWELEIKSTELFGS